jgi:hypothetical protein
VDYTLHFCHAFLATPVGRRKLTHSLVSKAPGFNPCTYRIKTRFQILLFSQIQLVHRYAPVDLVDRVDRVKYTLRTMGSSILKGGGTTLMGTLPMAFSKSTIFRTFFALLFSTVGRCVELY